MKNLFFIFLVDFDYAKLRRDLINYFGTVMNAGFYMAIGSLSDIEVASNDELIQVSLEIGFDLGKYQIDEDTLKR